MSQTDSTVIQEALIAAVRDYESTRRRILRHAGAVIALEMQLRQLPFNWYFAFNNWRGFVATIRLAPGQNLKAATPAIEFLEENGWRCAKTDDYPPDNRIFFFNRPEMPFTFALDVYAGEGAQCRTIEVPLSPDEIAEVARTRKVIVCTD